MNFALQAMESSSLGTKMVRRLLIVANRNPVRLGGLNRNSLSRLVMHAADPNFDDPDDFWRLRLYVAGQTPKSLAAFANLKKVCEQHLAGKYEIELVDLVKNPE